MMERGYLDSREMSAMFNLLRSNDLIWANVVNNYLMGNPPPAFDLLYWNSDGTRMARTAHSWYLRNTYVENNLIKPGHVTVIGEPVNLGRIEQDIYAVGAEKDHIVPWYAAWRITQLTKGRVRFVRASSGHIAGVINHPGRKKGAYWVNEEPATSPEAWLDAAAKQEGSWWTDWVAWLGERSGGKVKPPALGSNQHPPQTDAPGDVRAGEIAMDLVCGTKRVVVAMQHTAKGKPNILRKCNLPLTLVRRVDLMVTEMAVIAFPGGRATLMETAPGVSVEQVVAATEAKLAFEKHLPHIPN
jgi:hypothetical protein